jgi:hypothetical protein
MRHVIKILNQESKTTPSCIIVYVFSMLCLLVSVAEAAPPPPKPIPGGKSPAGKQAAIQRAATARAGNNGRPTLGETRPPGSYFVTDPFKNDPEIIILREAQKQAEDKLRKNMQDAQESMTTEIKLGEAIQTKLEQKFTGADNTEISRDIFRAATHLPPGYWFPVETDLGPALAASIDGQKILVIVTEVTSSNGAITYQMSTVLLDENNNPTAVGTHKSGSGFGPPSDLALKKLYEYYEAFQSANNLSEEQTSLLKGVTEEFRNYVLKIIPPNLIDIEKRTVYNQDGIGHKELFMSSPSNFTGTVKDEGSGYVLEVKDGRIVSIRNKEGSESDNYVPKGPFEFIPE